MKHLPSGIATLIIFLALTFNLERIDYIQTNKINIHGFLYVIITLFVVLIILIPFSRRLSYPFLLLIVTAIFVVWKIWVFPQWTWWGGNQSYVTIVELTLLLTSVSIARYTAAWLDDFVNAVENVTFARLRRVKTFDEVGEDIESEMYRSRRYQHPLTVVVAKPDVETLRMAIHRTVEEVQRAMLVRYVSISLMTRALFGQLRRTDWLLEQSNKKQYIFVLPETKGDRADIIVDRIKTTADELGVIVSCGIATFPDDSLTFDGLMDKAEERMSPASGQPNALMDGSLDDSR